MKPAERERMIKANMALGMTREEAEEVVADDEAIDRGERLDWEPTPEEEKEMRKANRVKADRKPRAKGEKKERKPDDAKREIISKIAEIFQDYDNFAVTNIEKTIEFSVNGENFSVNLTKHREKKA